MKLIPLTQGKFAKVDDEDYEWLNQWKWFAVVQIHHNTPYARRRDGSIHISMHRVVLGITNPKILIDHKDGDGLNNQRNNIRIATNSQNAANIQHSKYAGQYVGVSTYRRKTKGGYRAQYSTTITKNNRVYKIACKSMHEAAAAYNMLSIMLQGEFARTNIVRWEYIPEVRLLTISDMVIKEVKSGGNKVT